MKTGFLLGFLMGILVGGAAQAASEPPSACRANGGVCGCSYGQILCCDGSYSPRFYKDKDGQIVSLHCAAPTASDAKARNRPQGQTLPDYKPFTPSQETYWRRSVF